MPSVRRMILGHVLSDTCAKMNRIKKIRGNVMETPLKRCLSTFEITLLGIGHMVGAGIYVLTGIVACCIAGPGIVLSFLLAGFASLMAALCYAEFGARVPKAGSAYVYTYVSIGEFWAFIIGWNIILEHMIGAASVARAWSAYVDSLAGGVLSDYSSQLVCGSRKPDDPPCFVPDILAAVVCLVYTIPLAAGVKASAMVNAILTLVNLGVMILIGGMGFYYADIDNWINDKGGFLPFGFNGVLAGAATCFYAFVGFDSIATAGEEAREPAKSIPIATIVAMLVVTTAYIVIGGTLTTVVPFSEINPTTALLDAFSGAVPWAKYVISIGALCGMTTTLFGSLFSLPRTMYSMASDGLLFGICAQIFPFTRVPIFNLIFTGVCCSSIAFYFDLQHLVEFMSIGTFLAYTIVSASVIVLRYRPEILLASNTEPNTPSTPGSPLTEGPDSASDCNSIHSLSAELLDVGDVTGKLKPRYSCLAWALGRFKPGRCVTFATLLFAVLCVPMSAMLNILFRSSSQLRMGDYFVFVFLSLMLISCLFIIGCHHQNPGLNSKFRVALVPFVPALSIFCNIGLMFHLSSLTWIRFLVWMTLGMLVYFLYGIHHSKEAMPTNSRSNLMASSEAGRGAKWGATLGQKSDKVPILSYDETSK